MVLVENSLKNAYIGGYHEYEYTYDFTTWSTSDLQSKWWTVPTGSVINSNGYYNSSKNRNAMTINLPQLQTAVQTATKVIYWLSWTASWSQQRVFALASWSTEICLFYWDWQSASGGNQASFWQQTIVNESGYTYWRSGTFTTTITVDLENKTRQYEWTNHTTLTWTVTDTAIASFRTVDGIRVYWEQTAYITWIWVKIIY